MEGGSSGSAFSSSGPASGQGDLQVSAGARGCRLASAPAAGACLAGNVSTLWKASSTLNMSCASAGVSSPSAIPATIWMAHTLTWSPEFTGSVYLVLHQGIACAGQV